jgi:hypothetical protein
LFKEAIRLLTDGFLLLRFSVHLICKELISLPYETDLLEITIKQPLASWPWQQVALFQSLKVLCDH